jgi:hypothetical protein
MLTTDDLDSLSGATIAHAELRGDGTGQMLRLHLETGAILALWADSGGLHMADQTSLP